MTDLAAFLLARIAEDEAAITSRDFARPIHFVGCYYYEYTLDANLFCDCDKDGAASTRYLAECEAKRRIVQLDICTACAVEHQPCNHRDETLRLLALPYADHPDWREEWRP